MTAGTAADRGSIAGPAGPLEVIVEDPGVAAGHFAIVCHPHPLYGGTMENKVVTTVARALREAAVPTVRFNFRGVGKSGGAYDSGDGETDDADAVASFGAHRWPGRRLVIAGFSFGSYVAMRLSQRRPPSHLITIAPPVDGFDFSAMSAPACPWLVVQGDPDEVVKAQNVTAWVQRFSPVPQFVLMPGAGHFFHGRLNELRGVIVDAIRSG